MGRRAKKICHWCKRQLERATSNSSVAHTKDHVYPKSKGGKRTVPCCRACNNLKGDMTPGQWHDYMAENPEWWKTYNKPRQKRETILIWPTK